MNSMVRTGVTETATVKERPKEVEPYGYGRGERFPRRGNSQRKGPEEEGCSPSLGVTCTDSAESCRRWGRRQDPRPFRAREPL